MKEASPLRVSSVCFREGFEEEIYRRLAEVLDGVDVHLRESYCGWGGFLVHVSKEDRDGTEAAEAVDGRWRLEVPGDDRPQCGGVDGDHGASGAKAGGKLGVTAGGNTVEPADANLTGEGRGEGDDISKKEI